MAELLVEVTLREGDGREVSCERSVTVADGIPAARVEAAVGAAVHALGKLTGPSKPGPD
jgi:hypothetical protein